MISDYFLGLRVCVGGGGGHGGKGDTGRDGGADHAVRGVEASTYHRGRNKTIKMGVTVSVVICVGGCAKTKRPGVRD
jgi:hypothetical protein